MTGEMSLSEGMVILLFIQVGGFLESVGIISMDR